MKYGRKAEKIESIVDSVFAHPKYKEKFIELRIRNHWAEIMGHAIQSYTHSIVVRKRKIYITFDSATLRQELFQQKNKVLKNLNDFLGFEYLIEIIFR